MKTCAKCGSDIEFRNGGWVHVLSKELTSEAMGAEDIQARVSAFLLLIKDHAAEPK